MGGRDWVIVWFATVLGRDYAAAPSRKARYRIRPLLGPREVTTVYPDENLANGIGFGLKSQGHVLQNLEIRVGAKKRGEEGILPPAELKRLI